MKSNRIQSAVNGFFAMIAAVFFLSAGSAAAQANAPADELHGKIQSLLPHPMEPARKDVIAHCGCDSKEGIEKYVQNLINDAKQRGITCESAKMHVPACIAVYCSICGGHPGLVEKCIKMGAEYFTASTSFCQAEGKLAAGSAW